MAARAQAAFAPPRPDPSSAITVCICSYRRPEIVATLAALARQKGLDAAPLVVVADNTAEAFARPLVDLARDEFDMPLQYVHAPANNISIARNACLDAARTGWVAFLDDDEVPAPNWLSNLRAETAQGWDAVLGPVKALYPEGTANWLAEGDFHSTRPVQRRRGISTGYTGNVLFRRDFALRHGLRFREELGRSGGEDEDFFYRFHDAGGTIGFAPRAVCYEPVPAARANLHWLIKRSFRSGQSHGRRLKASGKGRLGMLLPVAKCVFCIGGAALCAAAPVKRRRYAVRAALHAGAAAKLSGLGEIEMY
ncbi:MAG: glycosyltransferase family 2 protein [Alphaproteobacteria bacterium]|nr:glycosyltransferase family 2 protein [Alphaproteobacteria bacterium]MBV9692144.1 glycosyltransferase family 2 protein [Alphaproteobacteria bacterium]